MAFTDRPSTEKVLGGVFLAFICAWAIRFISAGGVIEYFEPDKRIENEIEALLASEPGGEVVLRRLESDFPKKHDELLAVLRNRAKQDQGGERLGPTAVTWIRGFFAGHERDFGYAPLPELDTFISLQKGLVDIVAETDISRCDALAVGLPSDAEPSIEIRELGARAMEARFDAIRAGRKDQQLRLSLNPTDYEAVSATLIAKGASEDQLEFLSGDLNGSVLEKGKPCEALQMLVETIIEQPDERRALLIGAYASQG